MRVLRRPIPLLTAAIGVIGANSLVLPPIAPAVAADLSTEVSLILRAAAAFGAGTALSALVLAPRADVVGADKALRWACALLIVALILSACAPSVGLLILGQAMAGLGAGMALPSIYSLAAQLAPKGREKQTIGSVLTGWTLSLIGGVTLAAVIADHLGWRAVYGIMCLMTLAIWILLGRCQMAAERHSTGATSPFAALRVPGLGRGLWANAMLMLAFNGAYIYLGAHVVEHMHRSTSSAGMITMFYGAGFGLAVFFNKYLEMLSIRQVGVFAFGGLTLVYTAMDLASLTYAVFLPIAFVWGIFQHFALNMVVDRLTSLDPRQRGAIMGLNSAVTYLTVMGGAVFYKIPYDAGGLSYCLALSALFAAIAATEALLPNRIKTCSAAE